MSILRRVASKSNVAKILGQQAACLSSLPEPIKRPDVKYDQVRRKRFYSNHFARFYSIDFVGMFRPNVSVTATLSGEL
jgi:hypothetical protein